MLCRAIYVFASAIADERKYPDFWQKWEHFEGLHGNPDTWREMTRIRRSVAASYSTLHFNTTNVEAAVDLQEELDPMAALEAAAFQKQALPGFVAGGVQGGDVRDGANGEPAAKKVRVQEENPEEIDLGDDGDD
jgi:pre-mRNA-splicing factor SYF1